MRKLPQLLLLAALVFPGKVFADELRAGAASVVTTPAVEPFTDANRNQQRDENEPFQDLNGNGQWDPVWLAGYRGDRPALRVHDDQVRALGDRLRREGTVSREVALKLFRRVASGLAAAHAAGIFHRDVRDEARMRFVLFDCK
jgi:hypothetical protein